MPDSELATMRAATLQGALTDHCFSAPCLGAPEPGYDRPMLWTILIILAIIALVLFILGRRALCSARFSG